jgi:hypothetical protein
LELHFTSQIVQLPRPARLRSTAVLTGPRVKQKSLGRRVDGTRLLPQSACRNRTPATIVDTPMSERTKHPTGIPSARLCVLVATNCFIVCMLPFIEGPTRLSWAASQIFGICLAIGILATPVVLVRDWVRNRVQALFGGGLVTVVILVIPRLVHELATTRFEQVRPQLEQVVEDIRQDRSVATNQLSLLPKASTNSTVTYAVLARRTPDTGLTVEFLTRARFPVKHAGYLFESTGVPSAQSKERWPRCSTIGRRTGNTWFRISD